MKRPAILCLVLMAAACTEEAAAPVAEQGGEAAGEVLGGSISDAMIPLEQLGSEAPLVPPRTASSGADRDADAGEADDNAVDSEGAEAAPAAPAPELPAEE